MKLSLPVLIGLGFAISFSSCKQRNFGSAQKSTSSTDPLVLQIKKNFITASLRRADSTVKIEAGMKFNCTEVSAKLGDFSTQKVTYDFTQEGNSLANKGSGFGEIFSTLATYSGLSRGISKKVRDDGLVETVFFKRSPDNTNSSLLYGERTIRSATAKPSAAGAKTLDELSQQYEYANTIGESPDGAGISPGSFAISYLACDLVTDKTPVQPCSENAIYPVDLVVYDSNDCSGESIKNKYKDRFYYGAPNAGVLLFKEKRFKGQDCSCKNPVNKNLELFNKESGECTKISQWYMLCDNDQQFIEPAAPRALDEVLQ